jgi:hypothetical protein
MGTKGFFDMQTLLFIIVGEQKQKNLTGLGSLKRDLKKGFFSFLEDSFMPHVAKLKATQLIMVLTNIKAQDNLLLMTESL